MAVEGKKVIHNADMRTALREQDNIARPLRAEAANQAELRVIRILRDAWSAAHNWMIHPDDRVHPG